MHNQALFYHEPQSTKLPQQIQAKLADFVREKGNEITSKVWMLGTREMDAGGTCTAARSGIARRWPVDGAAEAQLSEDWQLEGEGTISLGSPGPGGVVLGGWSG